LAIPPLKENEGIKIQGELEEREDPMSIFLYALKAEEAKRQILSLFLN
jgi:hypothetical protein